MIQVQFSPEEAQQAQYMREQKDALLGANYFNSATRWCGDLGEQALERLFNANRVKYSRLTTSRTKDECDFVVGDLSIDVKTISLKQPTVKPLNCNVLATQTFNNQVNTYVFSVYSIIDNTCLLVGWYRKEDFIKNASYVEKGYRITEFFTAPADMYYLPVTDLWPMDMLLSRCVDLSI